LISRKANVHAKDEYGITVLYYAIMQDNREHSSLLIAPGVEANVEDGPGSSSRPVSYVLRICTAVYEEVRG
jgi:hypothetical protein